MAPVQQQPGHREVFRTDTVRRRQASAIDSRVALQLLQAVHGKTDLVGRRNRHLALPPVGVTLIAGSELEVLTGLAGHLHDGGPGTTGRQHHREFTVVDTVGTLLQQVQGQLQLQVAAGIALPAALPCQGLPQRMGTRHGQALDG
mgnify:CR=1 FL=1